MSEKIDRSWVPIQSEITAPDMRWRTPLPFIQKSIGILMAFINSYLANNYLPEDFVIEDFAKHWLRKRC